jgi:hypothetical protein
VAFEIAKTKERRLKKQRQKNNTILSPSLWPEKQPDNPYRLSHAISKSNTPHKNITSSAQCERPCTEKLDEENSKHAGLAQENGFVPCAFA